MEKTLKAKQELEILSKKVFSLNNREKVLSDSISKIKKSLNDLLKKKEKIENDILELEEKKKSIDTTEKTKTVYVEKEILIDGKDVFKKERVLYLKLKDLQKQSEELEKVERSLKQKAQELIKNEDRIRIEFTKKEEGLIKREISLQRLLNSKPKDKIVEKIIEKKIYVKEKDAQTQEQKKEIEEINQKNLEEIAKKEEEIAKKEEEIAKKEEEINQKLILLARKEKENREILVRIELFRSNNKGFNS
jgi:hypothetical protein